MAQHWTNREIYAGAMHVGGRRVDICTTVTSQINARSGLAERAYLSLVVLVGKAQAFGEEPFHEVVVA